MCKIWIKALFFLWATALIPNLSSAQSILDEELSLRSRLQTVSQHLENIKAKTGIQFSYSSNQLNQDTIVRLRKDKQKLSQHLSDILNNQKLYFKLKSDNRIIITLDNRKKWYRLSGLIRDIDAGDPLTGVLVFNRNNGEISYTNEDGYYTIKVSNRLDTLEFRFIGYEEITEAISLDKSSFKNYYIKSNNVIPQILITSQTIGNTHPGHPGGKIIRPQEMASFSSFLGDNNVDQEIRNMPSIQNGNEGQAGFHVRGGGSDQNLVLYEGVPLYESNHTAGLSSIFVSDAIKDVMVFTSGAPARYGGRLSSIMDLKLKSGQSDSIKGSVGLSMTGVNFYISGPIKKDTLSFNISGRQSILNQYLKPLLRKAYSYEDANLNFQDFNVKFHYKIDPSSSLSFTFYSGSDQIRLERNTDFSDGFLERIEEKNEVGWDNQMFALNYNNVISNHWNLKAHISSLSYNFNARGSYGFLARDAADQAVDIITFSKINDINARFDLKYQKTDELSFRMGAGRMVHEFNPTIKQRTVTIDLDPKSLIDGDAFILANESYVYLEGQFKPTQRISFNTGIRIAFFDVRDKSYSFTEPRFNLDFKINNSNLLNFSFTQMSQYHHRLVNPSLGIPSDLWVPSTENIPPEFSTQYSLSYQLHKRNNLNFGLSLFNKEYQNLLEYTNSFDLLYSIINEGDFIPVFNTSGDWERTVSTGKGRSYGVELNFQKTIADSKITASYALGKSTRQFDDINKGLEFNYTYDRTHDFKTYFNWRVAENWDFAGQFIYGTGNTFTLALEQFESPSGLLILNSSQRNNYRLKPYHHLDLNINYLFNKKYLKGKFSFGIYNVYNNLNPYYAYLYKDPDKNKLVLRYISLFPLIPHIGFKTQW